MNLDANSILQYVGAVAAAVGLKLLGALALWIVGRWLIKLASKLVTRGLARQNLDPTLINYIGSSLGVLLNIVLIVAILGFFGVQTATFAALLAGVGIAIIARQWKMSQRRVRRILQGAAEKVATGKKAERFQKFCGA